MAENKSPSNKILAAVPAEDLDHIFSKLELVPLNFGEQLHQAGAPIRSLYFPESGLVSLVASTEDSSYIEIGMLGREAVAGFPVALGALNSVGTTMVQVGGEAYKISAGDFSELCDTIPSLQRATLRSIHGLMTQTSLAAACNAFHPADRRLARWLLMTRDRVHQDEFPITQDFLSQMVGVRREAVNKYVGELRDGGFIEYTRGKIIIKDRSGLEDVTCNCYYEIEAAYNGNSG